MRPEYERAICDDQRRALLAFRQKIPHGPIERTRHADRVPFVGEERKRALDPTDSLRPAAEHAGRMRPGFAA